MAFTEKPPPPPAPNLPRYNPDGTPTPVQIKYEAALTAWLKRLAASIP